MTAIETLPDAELHPIDMVESLAQDADWEFDRVGEDRIAMAIEGGWRTYSVTLVWSDRDDMLRLVCAFEMEPEATRLPAVHDLLNRINDRVWGGCFTHVAAQGVMVFRAGLSLAGGATATPEQVEEMVAGAVCLSERYYPALQLVAWSDEAPEAALRVALEEAYGTA